MHVVLKNGIDFYQSKQFFFKCKKIIHLFEQLLAFKYIMDPLNINCKAKSAHRQIVALLGKETSLP